MNLLDEDERYQFRFWITETDPLGLDFDRTTLNDLSPGIKARLQLAFMLAKTKATVLFVDEALTHMDKKSQKLWIKILKQYAKDHGKLIIMAEKEVVTGAVLLDGVFELKDESIQMRQSMKKKRVGNLLAGIRVASSA